MELEELLRACLSVDNQARKQAEDAIKTQSQRPEIVPHLLHLLQQSPDPQVRHLAALLLRKRISRHWKHLPAEMRSQGQALLLDLVMREPQHPVRRAVADVIAALAKLLLPKSQWPELLPYLHQASGSPQAEHREVALTLFSSLMEAVGDALQTHLQPLLQIVLAGLKDPSEPVRTAALKAIEPLIAWVLDAKSMALFHQLVDSMLHVAANALRGGAEHVVIRVCQLLVDIVECPAPLLQPAMPHVLQLCVEVAGNRQLELGTRETALEIVHWVARCKPKQLERQKAAVQALLQLLCALCCEPPAPGEDEDDAIPAYKLGSQALDTVACNLSSSGVFPHVLACAKAAAASADEHQRSGAMVMLSAVAEGCSESVCRRMKDVLPLVLGGLRDDSRRVRGQAAFAVGQLSQFCTYEMVEHYEALLPLVFAVMADPDPDVQLRACFALDAFVESLEKDILPYLPQLVDQLVHVLSTTHNHDVQEAALSALASGASAAGKDFQPHTGRLLPIVEHFMQQTSPQLLRCRCRATECVGLMVEALDKAGVQQMVAHFMALALRGFEIDDSELKEFSHGMFANIAEALGTEFAQPYLPHVVPLALATCAQRDAVVAGGSDEEDDEEEAEADEQAASASGGGGGGFFGGISDSDDDEGDDGRGMRIRTAVLDEKSAALHALGTYAAAAPAAFIPYAEQTLAAVQDAATYFHEVVRAQAAEAIHKLVKCCHTATPPPAGAAMAPPVAQLLATATALLRELAVDGDKIVVASALASFTQLIKSFGMAALADSQAVLFMEVLKILKGKADCQKEDEDEDDGDGGGGGHEGDEEDEGGEEDEELLVAVVDLLPALADALGHDKFGDYFDKYVFPAVLGALKPHAPEPMRATLVGGMAELVRTMHGRMAGCVDKLMPVLFRELRGEDAMSRQNAAFCAGVLAQACPQAAAPFFANLLQALHPLFAGDENAGARDNAAGAVARMMLVAPGEMPLEAVVPVVLSSLPLKEDLDESAPVYSALCQLLTGSQAQRVVPLVPRILRALAEAAAQQAVALNTRRAIASTLAGLQARYPEDVGVILSALPAEQQHALSQLLASS